MKKLRVILTIAGALLAGACSDNTAAPSSLSSPDATTQGADATIPGGGANAALTVLDTVRFSFEINPKKTITYPLGLGNSITFPAGSLCDLSSSYGPDQWDQPCDVSKRPVKINAKAWLDANGHPRIDFDQHIRFVPSADPLQWVQLTLRDNGAAQFFGSIIAYCATPTSPCVDESLTDPTVATIKDPLTGQLTRRIKHFSGYNVFAGYSDGSDASSLMNRVAPDPTLRLTPQSTSKKRGIGGAAKRGGYMLAWG